MEKLFLYSVCKVSVSSEGDTSFDFGLPFVAIDDRAACGMVKKSLAPYAEKLSDLSAFELRLVGIFSPSSGFPVLGEMSEVVTTCDKLFKEVNSDNE